MNPPPLRHMRWMDNLSLLLMDYPKKISPSRMSQRPARGYLSEPQNKPGSSQAALQAAVQKNQRLSDFYKALSLCNKAIVHCDNEQDLFNQICRAVVDFGGMKTAWIGLIDEAARKIKPVASYGKDTDFLTGLEIPVDGTDPSGFGPSGMAIRYNKPFWCQDFQHDPATAPWRDNAARFGWGASASLPLHRNGVLIGVFTIFAEVSHAYDELARNLLLEMATDVSYALTNLQLEAERQDFQLIKALRVFILERITSAIALPDIMRDVVWKLESILPGSLCTILLLDKEGQHLHLGAGASLPDFYNAAMDGVRIGAGAGSCGNAAFTATRTIVADIARHPYWEGYAALAQKAGLGACWSEPILSVENKVLGTFAIYHRTPCVPGKLETALMEMAAHYIGIVIERKQAEAALRKLSQAVEQSANAILITDTKGTLEYANAAFVKNTGYSLDEIIGKNPRLHQSGKTPRATYADMWAHLGRGESWQGEFINLRKDGTEHVDHVRISPVRDSDGCITHYLAIEEDITEKIEADQRIRHLAHFDALTGLPNRKQLEKRAKYVLSMARRNQTPVAVMFLDIDHFKNINDSLGHDLGDSLLVEVGRQLRMALREEDILSRQGGDEFTLLLHGGTNEHGLETVAQKLLDILSQPLRIGPHEIDMTTSIGIALFPDDGADLLTLAKNAEVAMYRAKQEGRNSYRFFTQEMQRRSTRYLSLLGALRHALARDQLQVHYQPQVSLVDGQIIGAEALLRWQHPELGAVSPAEFIPIAEESGLIVPIGEWVLRTAVQQVRKWNDHAPAPLVMAVNLSAVQFRHANLPGLVTRILEEAGVAPECLELELTEGVAMHDPQGAIAIMNDLHARGIRMSIDDFGTGYSSLSYLKKFKVYKLKIDQSFVRDISTDADDKAIVCAIIGMARSLGMITIAEGVETDGQRAFLLEKGCDEAQGYFYSRPVPAAQFSALLAAAQAT